MHLLYLDDSGSIADPSQNHFVLAGLAVFERGTHWIEQDLNEIAKRFDPHQPYSVELHGHPMRTGGRGWNQFPVPQRLEAIRDALAIGIRQRFPRDVRLFGAVLCKANFAGQDIAQVAFEQICSRFDQFLGRLYRINSDPQRGLILFDKSSIEKRIQTLARDFKYTGHTFGVTRNYAEVPVFLDSKASRLIQLADLISYSTYRKFEHGDDSFFSIISGCFDEEGGVKHGLYCR
jgi:hypothetical protein